MLATVVNVAVLETLFDHMLDTAFFVKGADGRYVAINTSLAERHGYTQKGQILGQRPCDICPGMLGDHPTLQDEEVLQTGRPLIEHLELHWKAPNEPVWCLTTKLPMRDALGHIIGLIGVSRDVRAAIKLDEISPEFAVALNQFEKNLNASITPSTLATTAQMPLPRFSRLLKRLCGCTPIQYIAKTRIAVASHLLRDTTRSIADIALTCGFYDQSAFARTFRKIAGKTPTQFRNAVHSDLL